MRGERFLDTTAGLELERTLLEGSDAGVET